MCCKYCNGEFIKLFLKQFLDIGKSTGSLIGEIVGLFRTFQKLTAPKTVSTRFSRECLELLRWATDLFFTLTNYIRTNPLSDFEFFSIYTYVFPLTLLCFISSLVIPGAPILYYFVYGGFIMLGCGLGMIGINKSGMIGCIVSSVIVLGISFFMIVKNVNIFGCCSKCNSEDEYDTGVKPGSILHAFFIGCFVFCCTIYPIVMTRYKVQLILISIIIILLIIIICVFIITYSLSQDYIKLIILKVVSFMISLFPLLIIPSTEMFFSIIEGNYKGQWSIIASYIAIALVLPIAMTLLMIIKGAQDIQDKYKGPYYCYIELIDIMRQVAYAVCASYDILWGCVGLEIFWVVLIIIFRPYTSASEYSLSIGNSIVVLISNGSLIYTNYFPTKLFGYTVTIAFIIIACIPAILSLFLYFAIDFHLDDEDGDTDNYEFEESINSLSFFALMVTPVAWGFYGLVIPLIDNKVKINYDI